jgi:hypothetical protein
MEEVRENMMERARQPRNPFNFTNLGEVAPVIQGLKSADRDAWAASFSALAAPYEEKAARAEQAGNALEAKRYYLTAYDYHHVARYPAPNSPGKLDSYRSSQRNYLAAARYFDQPITRVEVPVPAAEGKPAVWYYRRPTGVEQPGIVVTWGGIDAFKEERHGDVQYLNVGLATLAIDMPGVGDAPLPGSETAERLWDAVFDWIDAQPDLDSTRVGIAGGSTGGYWAAKVAHTHNDRICAAVDHGGPAHIAFTPDWIAKSQRGEYPLELAETLASAFGLSTYDEWVDYSPKLSLLNQGVLDQPCAPLIILNGINDSVFPIEDMHLLLAHGNPKQARFFEGGHMGGPGAGMAGLAWLKQHLLA